MSCESSNIVQWSGLCMLCSAMSGIKRDCDLGRKFETVHPKDKETLR
jgi:hypothetical protein